MLKKTKMVCTIGPKSEMREVLESLLNAGMNVMRLNFSHGDFEEHGGRITNINAIMEETGKVFAVLLDTKGPEIRTCDLENGEDVTLTTGDKIVLTADASFVGNKSKVGVTYPDLAKDLKIGSTVLLDDGLIGLKVIDIQGSDVVCEVQNNGELGEHKGVNLPCTHISMPFLSEKDKGDLLFGIKRGVDFIAASFTRTKEDVLDIRNFLDANGGNDIKIICKIENQEGLDNFEDILATADGIMVARGDMGVEIPAQEVIFAQKHIIKRCNAVGKPVITATQMLDSMIKNPRPTRAEVTDIANAIFYRTDALMLSGETASGKYPVEAVQTMARIAEQAEKDKSPLNDIDPMEEGKIDQKLFLAHAAIEATKKLGVAGIITDGETGQTARDLAAFRGPNPVLAICYKEKLQRWLNLSYGIIPIHQKDQVSTKAMFTAAVRMLRQKGYLCEEDKIAYLSGSFGEGGGTTFVEINKVKKIFDNSYTFNLPSNGIEE